MKSSIKSRWFKNVLLAIIVVLSLCTVLILNSIYTRYTNTVEQTILSRISKSADTYFHEYIDSNEIEFAAAASDFVDSFLDKDIMEVWVLDKNGKMIVSSSGFSEDTEDLYDDYIEALYSDDYVGIARTVLESGEPVCAVSYILRDSEGESYGALRYMISLREINAQFLLIVVLAVIILIMLIMIFVMSGVYFISTIVNPVQKINTITKEIAKGNFKVRIESDYDDEIGELSASINEMALQLSEIDQMKNDFISTVSHEIRTPLTAIKGWGETLQNIQNDEELRNKGLTVIVDETVRLSTMVEELLDFSRIQSGRLQLNKSKTNVADICEQILLMYKKKSEEEKTVLEFKNKASDVFVYADSDKLRQVLINILDNAFKYTDAEGKIIIFLDKNRRFTTISVIDNGCGISSKDLQHVKEKFYKANNTVRGTGIGLAVVDEIVRMHDGKFEITSEPGKGTKVDIILPLYTKESDYE